MAKTTTIDATTSTTTTTKTSKTKATHFSMEFFLILSYRCYYLHNLKCSVVSPNWSSNISGFDTRSVSQHPPHIVGPSGSLQPSALIPFCSYRTNLSMLVSTVNSFKLPCLHSLPTQGSTRRSLLYSWHGKGAGGRAIRVWHGQRHHDPPGSKSKAIWDRSSSPAQKDGGKGSSSSTCFQKWV